MVRHIVLLNFRVGTTQQQIDTMASAMDALDFPGLLSKSWGMDLGLRAGNMRAAAVYDFEDEDALQAYDRDAEHNRIRRELTAPIVERAERCQYRI
jgi:hypothetical protein